MRALLAYTKAMERMTQRYPDDYETWVFYALTLQASASKNDKTYANQLKSAAILEKLLKQDPQHPGVAHFLIHAYDYPPLADKGTGGGAALCRHRACGCIACTAYAFAYLLGCRALGGVYRFEPCRPLKSSPIITMHPTFRSMRTYNSRKTPKPKR